MRKQHAEVNDDFVGVCPNSIPVELSEARRGHLCAVTTHILFCEEELEGGGGVGWREESREREEGRQREGGGGGDHTNT